MQPACLAAQSDKPDRSVGQVGGHSPRLSAFAVQKNSVSLCYSPTTRISIRGKICIKMDFIVHTSPGNSYI